MIRHRKMQSVLFEAIMYLFAWLLFLEWIYPVGRIADLTGIPILIMFSGWCFLVSLLSRHWWLGLLLKGAGLILALQKICYEGSFLQGSWVGRFTEELSSNLGILFSGSWQNLNEMFRVLLILVLIWLMSYLLHYWFVLMKRVLLFVLATIVYVSLLSTFLEYDAKMAIVRIFIYSILAFGLANILKTIDKEVVALPTGKQLSKALLVLVAFMLVTLGVAVASPQFEPQWPDPVPGVKQLAADKFGVQLGSPMRRVGYGEDDRQLGGSFVQDYSPVFKAIVPTDNYWRIETKDFYTGKGWKRSAARPLKEQVDGFIELSDQGAGSDKAKPQIGKVEFEEGKGLDKLLYPYGVERVREDKDFYLEPISEAIHIEKDGKSAKPDSYNIEYNYPQYNVEKLQKAHGSDPQETVNLYTQLPEQLPDRIEKLANKIISGQKNRYDQAKAIEQYFNQNGFSYETANVPVPKDNQDYVDQFLFDSKVGYCDNFSTAMVVMLRTQGIPARWAKGFTSGDRIGSEEVSGERFNVYEVTNANAHSWVEVYFPGEGWVPFEPTQGFSNEAQFNQPRPEHQRTPDLNAIGQNDSKNETKKDEERPATSSADRQPKPKEEGGIEKVQKKVPSASKESSVTSGELYLIVLIVVIVGIALAILYQKRWRIRTALVRKKLHQPDRMNSEEIAYKHVLALLAAKGHPKNAGETLSEYAGRMEQAGFGSEMIDLTRMYEALIYSGGSREMSKQDFISCWERLTSRILA